MRDTFSIGEWCIIGFGILFTVVVIMCFPTDETDSPLLVVHDYPLLLLNIHLKSYDMLNVIVSTPSVKVVKRRRRVVVYTLAHSTNTKSVSHEKA